MSESENFTAYEDELITINGRRYEGSPEEPAWFTWQCKMCGSTGSWGQSADEAMMVEETAWLGWWHVEKEMRNDNEGILLGMRIENEEKRKREETPDAPTG